ncbi:MAG: hypothetical protein HQL10_13985 [Nitrospirae bacterium]|nr:hypothetical protein [Nitrospirota bacterium]
MIQSDCNCNNETDCCGVLEYWNYTDSSYKIYSDQSCNNEIAAFSNAQLESVKYQPWNETYIANINGSLVLKSCTSFNSQGQCFSANDVKNFSVADCGSKYDISFGADNLFSGAPYMYSNSVGSRQFDHTGTYNFRGYKPSSAPFAYFYPWWGDNSFNKWPSEYATCTNQSNPDITVTDSANPVVNYNIPLDQNETLTWVQIYVDGVLYHQSNNTSGAIPITDCLTVDNHTAQLRFQTSLGYVQMNKVFYHASNEGSTLACPYVPFVTLYAIFLGAPNPVARWNASIDAAHGDALLSLAVYVDDNLIFTASSGNYYDIPINYCLIVGYHTIRAVYRTKYFPTQTYDYVFWMNSQTEVVWKN